MSDGPRPPGQPDPGPARPAWPAPLTRPQTWPEPPTVPGPQISLEPSAWPEQPPPWPRQSAAPGPAPGGRGAPGPERYASRPPEHHGLQYTPGQQYQEWAPLPWHDQEAPPAVVAPRSAAVSVLLSVFVPGLGSMVNGNARTGVTILVLNIVGWMLAIVLIGIPLAIGTWIWGLVDACQSAERWNRAHGVPG
jgi:TM2 domain-containing membrane protein YozV